MTTMSDESQKTHTTHTTDAADGFQFFAGARGTPGEPRITLRRTGQLILTPPAVALLGEGVTHVQVGFHPETRAVGLKAAGVGARGRYRLRAAGKTGNRLVDGRPFFAHLGVVLEQARAFPVEVYGQGIVGFRLPAAGGEAGTEAPAAPEPAPEANAELSPPPPRPRRARGALPTVVSAGRQGRPAA
jgi:hypothetical protein